MLVANPDVIRWGLVGAGSVCEVKSGPAFYKAPGSSLVAVMRRTKSAAEDFAKRHGVPKFYTELDELLQDPEVDAVYVATPPGTHKELALRVCAAGKPCYMEKPMARSHAECLDMTAAFEEAKLPLYIGYYRRYLPKFVYVKSVIDSGTIGRVTSVNLRLSQSRHKFEGEEVRADWRVDATNAGGGLFMDLGSHQLDLLDHLLGPLRPLGGTAQRLRPTAGLPGPCFAVEDVVCLSFSTASGAVGTASWNFCSGVWDDTIDIVGEFGSLSFSCFNNKPVRLEVAAKRKAAPVDRSSSSSGSAAPRAVERLKEPEVTMHQAEQPDHVHQPLVEAVLRDLRLWASLPKDAPERARLAAGLRQEEDEARASGGGGGGVRDGCCSSTGRAAARTALVMDRALEGFYGGPGSRDQAFWESPEKWDKALL
ncbi:unnamed protein product [Ectocarpus sp. 6 AP-2014]